MNLTWSSLKTRSQVVRTNILRWSLVPSEKGLLVPGVGVGGGASSASHGTCYQIQGTLTPHMAHPRNQISILGVNPRYSRPHMKPTWHWRSRGSAFIDRVVVSFPFSFCLFFKKPWQFSYLFLLHIFNPMRLICSLLNKETIASSCWRLNSSWYCGGWGWHESTHCIRMPVPQVVWLSSSHCNWQLIAVRYRNTPLFWFSHF